MAQSGGTCWLHATLNGFLLSKIGRMYLQDLVRDYKGTARVGNNACPLPNHTAVIPYIRRYLNEGFTNTNNNIQVLAPNKKRFGGGQMRNIERLHKMFPDVLITTDSSFPRITALAFLFTRVTRQIKNHIISHAYIGVTGYTVSNKPINHAITGFINSKNKYCIYDSNGYYKELSDRWDTRKGTTEIKNFVTEIYKLKPDTVNVIGKLAYVPKPKYKATAEDTKKLLEIESQMAKHVMNIKIQLNNNIRAFSLEPIRRRRLSNNEELTLLQSIKNGRMNTKLTTSSNNSFTVQQAKENRQRIVAKLIKNGRMNNELSVFYTNSHAVKRAKYDRIADLISKALQNSNINNEINLITRAGLTNTTIYNDDNINHRPVSFKLKYITVNANLSKVLDKVFNNLKMRRNARRGNSGSHP